MQRSNLVFATLNTFITLCNSLIFSISDSPEKPRVKPSSKKHNQKIRDRENDPCRRKNLHPCEILLSLMFGSEHHKKITMRSLKKSRGDLSEFLTQLSIGFAGIRSRCVLLCGM